LLAPGFRVAIRTAVALPTIAMRAIQNTVGASGRRKRAAGDPLLHEPPYAHAGGF
jgi:hypothetical protein